MSIKDGVKSKYNDYDRLDEVVDFMERQNQVDWFVDNAHTMLPPIIREQILNHSYYTVATCYNTDKVLVPGVKHNEKLEHAESNCNEKESAKTESKRKSKRKHRSKSKQTSRSVLHGPKR